MRRGMRFCRLRVGSKEERCMCVGGERGGLKKIVCCNRNGVCVGVYLFFFLEMCLFIDNILPASTIV